MSSASSDLRGLDDEVSLMAQVCALSRTISAREVIRIEERVRELGMAGFLSWGSN